MENREYDKAMAGWRELAGLNNNFDLAYLGIGKTLLEQGDYQAAMENFRLINNRSYYSRAYKLYRRPFSTRSACFWWRGRWC